MYITTPTLLINKENYGLDVMMTSKQNVASINNF